MKVPKLRHSSSAEAAAKVEASPNQNNNSQGDVTEKDIIVHRTSNRQKKKWKLQEIMIFYGNSDFK
jgi:ABC-type uncharacterized transport system involved in gliding motility auxiliary subunit